MKQDRFLTGILIGIAVLVIVALLVFFIRKDNLVYVAEDTPAGVVQNYVVALHKHDYQRAYNYLADLDGKPTLDQFQQSFLNHSVDPTNAAIEIGKTETTGKSATVALIINNTPRDPFSGEYRNTDYAELISQSGNWKIKQMPYGNFWAFDWYQPKPTP
jgi:hypothetical protein